MKKARTFIGLSIVISTAPLKVDAAQQPFFHGKTITLQVGSGAGGRQDRIARTLAKYLPKYTPGSPVFVIQNKPGGQGIPAMLALSKGPTDGSFMSMVISSFLEAPYFGAPGANYDPRSFVYVGAPSTGKQRNVLVVHQRTGIKTLDDLKKREVTLGAQGVGNRSYLYARLIAELLGLKVRWVLGYDTQQLYVAIEQGEVQGRVNDAASMMTDRPEWFAKRAIIALLSMTLPEELPPVNHPVFDGIPSSCNSPRPTRKKISSRRSTPPTDWALPFGLPAGNTRADSPDHGSGPAKSWQGSGVPKRLGRRGSRR